MEEVGELARLVNHLHGEKPKKATEARQSLPDEIGDLIFTLVCLANAEGVDLQSAVEDVLAKFMSGPASTAPIPAPTSCPRISLDVE